ncbi:thiamine pyrophosphate-binding protein [Acuticoccus sp. MNP-M23]|uniref:thiamine pyrophosphate-binding protein n=1 Tax=Acuticoccus sp. MNP-M23 TaxID=3072793 RepID=UPI0028169E68|nr:thiamine pyrophosphate-binding protein [Acuticoccus sp. MNP-M23]WMS44337.1 thiamine pyrophosphate-binding protein [Acuticoccus sp. MNP-M23]
MERVNDNDQTGATRHGGTALVEALKAQGVERVFCIPGESYLAALDGFFESGIDLVVARHEGGAAMMADAHGKLTGKAGVAFVTRGPGATNAASGIHVAMQDSTPMVLFVGQVARDQRDREAFQEVDYRAMFAPLAKWVAEIEVTERIPEYVSHAFHVAQSGRPGPVVLALPEDMLSAACKAAVAPAATMVRSEPSEAALDDIVAALAGAERPLVIVGGGGWSAEAAKAVADFAEKWDLPVGTSFRCQDYIDNRSPQYVGDVGIGINPALADMVKNADVILALGPRLGEMTTSGYTLFSVPDPEQTLIHVHLDPSEPGRVYRPDIAVAASPAATVIALAGRPAPDAKPWAALRADAHAAMVEWRKPQATPGDVKMEQIVAHLSDVLPDDAIITNGAGNYAAWLHRYYWHRSYRTQLAPTSGSMGYGLPAAVAAKLAHPEREVICLAGDGCFQMSATEFGTACDYGANVVVIVSNNGVYGTIRMHQEKNYPGRPSGTGMRNPDFAAWARSYGAFGETVTRHEDFPAALERARKAGGPALIELKTDPAAISPRTKA